MTVTGRRIASLAFGKKISKINSYYLFCIQSASGEEGEPSESIKNILGGKHDLHKEICNRGTQACIIKLLFIMF